jgi:hypothetical protein
MRKEPRAMSLRSIVTTLTAAAATVLVALAAGCSSDLPNEVGSDLATIEVDSVLIPLERVDFLDYGALAVEDTRVPVSAQQVLYLGGQNGSRSSILVNFDFVDVFTEEFPESLFTAENISSVKLGMTKLNFYSTPADTTLPVPRIYYDVHQLAAPFDSTAFPGPVPAYDPQNLNIDYDLEQGQVVGVPLDKNVFLDWIAARDTVGLAIRAGAESDSSLVGYAARNLVRYTEVPLETAGTIVAPRLIVDFESEAVNQVIAPVADISTFDVLSPASPDGADEILVRTCMRQVPCLHFDLSALPDNAYINRAVLVMHNDTDRGFGQLQTLIVSEFDVDMFGDPFGTITLDELEAAVYAVTGTLNNEPDYNERFDFNVTVSVQRLVNGAYDGTRGFVITADEDVFTNFDFSTLDPDFWFNEFRFHGTAAGDSLRPRLQVTYSRMTPQEGATHE